MPHQLLAVLMLGEHADQHPTPDRTQGNAWHLVPVAEPAVAGEAHPGAARKQRHRQHQRVAALAPLSLVLAGS